jgi:hypothetical protein
MRGRLWPWFVVALLGGNVVAVSALVAASRTEHHIEPAYYGHVVAPDASSDRPLSGMTDVDDRAVELEVGGARLTARLVRLATAKGAR